jgi:hypothetical protein
MITVTSKYRGKKEYFLVWAKLICVAHSKQTITYKTLAPLAGLFPVGNNFASEIGHLLGEISEDEHNVGRYMLSGVAVNMKGIPGSGFFVLARQLGKLNSTIRTDEINFWNNELKAIYTYWA